MQGQGSWALRPSHRRNNADEGNDMRGWFAATALIAVCLLGGMHYEQRLVEIAGGAVGAVPVDDWKPDAQTPIETADSTTAEAMPTGRREWADDDEARPSLRAEVVGARAEVEALRGEVHGLVSAMANALARRGLPTAVLDQVLVEEIGRTG